MEPIPDTTHVEWTSAVALRSPILVAAFEGWNDAGDAATLATAHLRDRTDAHRLASIDAEPFYDFSVTRPRVELTDDRRVIRWPENTVWAIETDGPHDLLVLIGIEPQHRWRTFANQILGIATAAEVSKVITLGALLADVPHQRPVPVYGSADDQTVRRSLDLEESSYEGPTGIVGVVGSMFASAGVATASLWAAVPSYIPGATSPKAALALVERLHLLLGIEGTTTDLEIAASAYERQIDQMVEDDDETAEYVAQLLDHHDRNDELKPLSGDELAQQVERFLRDQPD